MEAFSLLQERFPQAVPEGTTARVVFAAAAGRTLTDPAYQGAIAETLTALGQIPDVTAVSDPFNEQAPTVSPDLRIGFAEVTFDSALPAANEELDQAVTPARDAGLTVELIGDALMEEFEQPASELFGIGVAAIVLIITFGSFVAAGLPLLNAIIGIGITVSAITLGHPVRGHLHLHPDPGGDAGAGPGHRLLTVHRLPLPARAARRATPTRPEAMGRALGTAGTAVVFAGLTVMIALVGLSVVGLRLLTEMGLAAAAAVAIAC